MTDPIPLNPTAARLLFPEFLGLLLVYATTKAGIALELDGCSALSVSLQCFRLVHGSWERLEDGNAPEYRILGNFWTQLHPACRWAGIADPGAFSLVP